MSETLIDATADCDRCGHPVEHVAGDPGSAWNTPFWRHVTPRPHGALPRRSTIRQTSR